MVPTHLLSRPSSHSDSVGYGPFEDPSVGWNSIPHEPGTCAWHLLRIIDQIESKDVQDVLRVVFGDCVRLLECLRLIESHLRKVDSADQTFALFQLIHDDARHLVEFIRTNALTCQDITDELAETFDGVTFVISHDLQRVFEGDSRRPLTEKAAHVILSKVHRAHDILTNCLQQSTISLAMVFDESLVGGKLFDNSDMRYQQSLQLCRELTALGQVVENFHGQAGEVALTELTEAITNFRNHSLECLMYSDWPQFENFCDRIKASTTDLVALDSVLHQFQCYLETLLSQVKMRAVLANQSTSPSMASSFSHFGDETDENTKKADPDRPIFALV